MKSFFRTDLIRPNDRPVGNPSRKNGEVASPGGVDGEPELDDVEADVLVEGVQDEFADARVVPRAVDQQQPQQETELRRAILKMHFTLYITFSYGFNGLIRSITIILSPIIYFIFDRFTMVVLGMSESDIELIHIVEFINLKCESVLILNLFSYII